MSNDYFVATGNPGTRAAGSSAVMRAQFTDLEAAFDKLPDLTGNAGKAVVVNPGSTGLTVTTGTLALAGNFAMVGAFSFAGTLTGNTAVTFPTSGTLATTTSGILTVGTTTIASGTSGRVLYDNAGTLGEMTTTGTGTELVLSTAPTLSDPVVGTQAAGDSSTKAASTAFVAAAVDALIARMRVFTTNDTYTPDANLVYCEIKCWGGGGGGGGTATSAASNQVAGGGGGAGGSSYKIATAADIGASKTVTIGAAGTAGTAGNNAGGNGGDTFVGALCIAKGGTGGNGSPGSGQTAGGAGGVAGTGDVTLVGQPGFRGSSISVVGSTQTAYGGSAPPVGWGGEQGAATANGGAATGFASGGGGGSSFNNGGARAGGAGTAGYVIITEYCSA